MNQTPDDMIQIPRKLADKLSSELLSLMFFFEMNPNGPDHRMCMFCYKRTKDDGSDIDHDDNCLGQELQKILHDQVI